jgi:hypothetical protein
MSQTQHGAHIGRGSEKFRKFRGMDAKSSRGFRVTLWGRSWVRYRKSWWRRPIYIASEMMVDDRIVLYRSSNEHRRLGGKSRVEIDEIFADIQAAFEFMGWTVDVQ